MWSASPRASAATSLTAIVPVQVGTPFTAVAAESNETSKLHATGALDASPRRQQPVGDVGDAIHHRRRDRPRPACWRWIVGVDRAQMDDCRGREADAGAQRLVLLRLRVSGQE